MTPDMVHVRGAEIAVYRLPGDSAEPAPLLLWAHGWGHSHAAFLPMAEAMHRSSSSALLDFPGFGAAPPPPDAWGTADYADAVAQWLEREPPARRIWIAHSFGCRVGLQLAARHPQLVDGLVLIAAAGLPPHRSPMGRLRFVLRRWAYRLARLFVPEGSARDRLRARFGSADYRQAGPMRGVLVKTVGENLSEAARAVRCPALLIYGDRDSETPPELGMRFNALMPHSRLVVLSGFDHWNVLTDGRHQIVERLREFLEQVA